ncbi:hypothetical protein M501DRAFT_934502 [Patellaria atrata CBS 101060]|uniref:WSC domain-containing protein n=1 Tax=Patellaria atrata CBS 101060 TaxID=1346257 RepID=A0A9P4VQR0_9PEZI|nr:hypothetical protein M501DRAFT_934502 [Patellaria atrata CBS 101060]
MVSSPLRSALAAASFLSLITLSSQQAIPTATYTGPLRTMTEKGCYDDPKPLVNHGPWTFQTSGNCQPICVQLKKPVMALVNGEDCWCGDLLPALSAKVDDDECNTPCNGFPDEMCGGNKKWRVLLTGITNNQIDHYDPQNPSGSQGPKTTAVLQSQAIITVGGSTVVVTAAPTNTNASQSTGGGPNKAGIAAGVVVGVVVISGAVVGVFLILRHRRRKQLEEDYRRQAAVSDFVNGGKGSSVASISDSRLDPETMFARRMSDGSIMDNQDYSRRILKVRSLYSSILLACTNP